MCQGHDETKGDEEEEAQSKILPKWKASHISEILLEPEPEEPEETEENINGVDEGLNDGVVESEGKGQCRVIGNAFTTG